MNKHSWESVERKLRRAKEREVFASELLVYLSRSPYPYATPEREKSLVSLDQERDKYFINCKSCWLFCPQGLACCCGCHECRGRTHEQAQGPVSR